MYRAICVCVAAFALLASAPCHAGGFFRRVPEVGEWARYELTMKVAVREKPSFSELDAPAMVGSLTLKCVGEETIDDVRHLWLEARMDIVDPGTGAAVMQVIDKDAVEVRIDEATEHYTLIKLLVPAEEVMGSDLAQHAVRAWCAGDQEEPREMDLAGAAFLEEPAAFAIINAFPATRTLVGRRQRRTMTIAGEEVQLASNESGELVGQEFDDADITGEAVWWPSADHAFGIAAAELQWTIAMPEEVGPTVLYTSRMDLVETGTGAVSDLPDHN